MARARRRAATNRAVRAFHPDNRAAIPENHAAGHHDTETAGPSSPAPLYCTKVQLVRYDDDQSPGKRVLLSG
jgi:hypothetical protein